MEAMWMLCLPTINKADELILNNRIGAIKNININHFKNQNTDKGILDDFGVYAIHFALHYMNSFPKKIHADVKRNQLGVDKEWYIKLEDKFVITINLSNIKHGNSLATIYGTNGKIEFTSPFNRTNNLNLYDLSNKLVKSYNYKYSNQGFEFQIKEVENSLKFNYEQSSVIPHKCSLDAAKLVQFLKINYLN